MQSAAAFVTCQLVVMHSRITSLALFFLCRIPLADRAEEGYLGFLASAPQVVWHPLMKFYEEWRRTCTLSEWMERMLRLGYSLQFCSVPPPSRDVKEMNLYSQEGMHSGPLSRCMTDRRGLSSRTSLLGRRGSSGPFWISVAYRWIARRMIHMLTIKRFTAINLKDYYYFHVEMAPKLSPFEYWGSCLAHAVSGLFYWWPGWTALQQAVCKQQQGATVMR